MATPLLDEGQRWRIDRADWLDWLAGLPEDATDLVVTSPPYEDCRTYEDADGDHGIARKTEPWVAWMADVVRACLRVCKGLVAVVCEGKQNDWAYSASPFLLLADLARSGVVARKPAVFWRNGISGSGHDAWRNDWEPILLFTRGGRLPWSDPTACGHAPKWAPGGEFSHRLRDGQRVNQWGANARDDGTLTSTERGRNGQRKRAKLHPKHRTARGYAGGDTALGEYTPPAIANPGNVLKLTVGGGNMGDKLCHENEAPYPEQLAEPFILSFCPPGGLVLDPFSGSGTTASVAVALGRRFLGCDLRQSQIDLATRRLLEVTPPLPGMEP